MDGIAAAIAFVGCVLTLLSSIGVVRFQDVLTRSHALTKAATIGVVFVLLGAAIDLEHPNDVTSLVLAGLLQVSTMPVGAHLVNRATFRSVRDQYEVEQLD